MVERDVCPSRPLASVGRVRHRGRCVGHMPRSVLFNPVSTVLERGRSLMTLWRAVD